MKAFLGYNVNSAVQQILHVHEQRAQCKARPLRRKRHEQINIAVITGIAPCHRPEHAYVAEAMTLRDSENLGTVSGDHGVHCRPILR